LSSGAGCIVVAGARRDLSALIFLPAGAVTEPDDEVGSCRGKAVSDAGAVKIGGVVALAACAAERAGGGAALLDAAGTDTKGAVTPEAGDFSPVTVAGAALLSSTVVATLAGALIGRNDGTVGDQRGTVGEASTLAAGGAAPVKVGINEAKWANDARVISGATSGAVDLDELAVRGRDGALAAEEATEASIARGVCDAGSADSGAEFLFRTLFAGKNLLCVVGAGVDATPVSAACAGACPDDWTLIFPRTGVDDTGPGATERNG
jgi:hypothetical protein